jgi:hypothetical protein
MKFLQLLAKIIKEGGIILSGFQPYISQVDPKATPVLVKADDVLVKIAGIVADAQVAGEALQLTGAQKLTAVTPLVAQAIKDSALLFGHEIQNLDAYTTAAQGIASNVVDLLNSLKASNIKVA